MKNNSVKILAYYLPQFHEIKENDDFWGKGYTEWVNVKKSKPVYWVHYQPRVPLNSDYYDLRDGKKIVEHGIMAQEYGIYGFCFYHYWFGERRQILQKPLEAIIEDLEFSIPFCFCWANETWTRTWNGGLGEKEVLMDQVYSDEEDWIAHINYLMPFFKNEMYIKNHNKPMFLIFDPHNIPYIIKDKMFGMWDEILKKNGFNGIDLVNVDVGFRGDIESKYSEKKVDFEPTKTRRESILENSLYSDVRKYLMKYEDNKIVNKFLHQKISYADTCNRIIGKKHNYGYYRSLFVGYDDTPRRGVRSTIYYGSTPEQYKRYLKKTIELSFKEGNEYLFLFAWNEWGEGGYLEPDEKYGFRYLESTKFALEDACCD